MQDKSTTQIASNCNELEFRSIARRSFIHGAWRGKTTFKKGGVTDGTRTRNSQNHNLELYH